MARCTDQLIATGWEVHDLVLHKKRDTVASVHSIFGDFGPGHGGGMAYAQRVTLIFVSA